MLSITNSLSCFVFVFGVWVQMCVCVFFIVFYVFLIHYLAAVDAK